MEQETRWLRGWEANDTVNAPGENQEREPSAAAAADLSGSTRFDSLELKLADELPTFDMGFLSLDPFSNRMNR